MSGSFSVTISSTSALGIGASLRSEATEINDVLQRGLQTLVSAHATSITLKTRNGATVGTMSWTPTNSA
jgi:hypothetical protein